MKTLILKLVAVSVLVIFNQVAQASSISSSQTVVGWGDSLTGGMGNPDGWPAQFAALSGVTTISMGVGGETSSQIATRFFATPSLFNAFTVIWAGRNNAGDPQTVESDIAGMVHALTTPNYLVLGVTNANFPGENIGEAGYLKITGLNSDLATSYGSKFIDIRKILVASYNPLLTQDIIDFGNDMIPTSLRGDSVHLNATGNAIVANVIYGAYTAAIVPAQIPLPPSIALFASGLFVFGFSSRKKNQEKLHSN